MTYTRAAPGFHRHALTTMDAEYASIANGPLYYSAPASGTWTAANKAVYIPVRVKRRIVVTKLGISNGATASGNLDLGLYDAAGVKLVSTGSTAQSGTEVEQVIDVTDTTIGPGLYYLAAAMDGTTGTVFRLTPLAPYVAAIGVYTQTSAFALPATATFAIDQTLAFYPLIHLYFGTVVA